MSLLSDAFGDPAEHRFAPNAEPASSPFSIRLQAHGARVLNSSASLVVIWLRRTARTSTGECCWTLGDHAHDVQTLRARRARSRRRERIAKANAAEVGDRHIRRMPLARLHVRDGGACWLCGELVDLSLPGCHNGVDAHPMSATRDHVLSVADGGSEVWSNLRLAHLCCNQLRARADGS